MFIEQNTRTLTTACWYSVRSHL